MSALTDDRPAPRRLRFARPAWEREPGVTWEHLLEANRPTPLPDAGSLRVPDALAPYVRSKRHFQLVIRAVLCRVGHESPFPHIAPPYRGARLACAQRVLRLLGASPEDPLIPDLLLLLFPPVPCAACGAPYLRENKRRVYCGDDCQRTVKAATQAARDRARQARKRGAADGL